MLKLIYIFLLQFLASLTFRGHIERKIMCSKVLRWGRTMGWWGGGGGGGGGGVHTYTRRFPSFFSIYICYLPHTTLRQRTSLSLSHNNLLVEILNILD